MAVTITKDTIIGDILDIAPETAPLFMAIGMHCLGCPASRGETVEEACMVHGIEVEELLEEFGLTRLAKQKAWTLSGGEKRRMEIARCMISNPKIILLDEPFVGIDPITVADLRKMIFKLKDKGIGVLITDHNVRETLPLTERAYLIYDGKILVEGDQNTLLNDKNARRLYLGEDFKM